MRASNAIRVACAPGASLRLAARRFDLAMRNALPEPFAEHALAAGATVVTPNRRLARALVALYDRGQRGAGRMAWAAARVLPWDAWLPALWGEALAAGVVPHERRLRTPSASGARVEPDRRRRQARRSSIRQAPRCIAADAWTSSMRGAHGGDSWRALGR